jgi:hypothetical protein
MDSIFPDCQELLSQGPQSMVVWKSVGWKRRPCPLVHPALSNPRSSRVLGMDETPIKAGRKAKGKMRQGYLWSIYGEADEIIFGYTP